MNPINRAKKTTSLYVLIFAVAALSPAPKAFGVLPPPDGSCPDGNTTEGDSALFSLTTGGFNTAVGWFSLQSDTTNSFNTAVGAGTLLANTADQNTATGRGSAFLQQPRVRKHGWRSVCPVFQYHGGFNTGHRY